MNLKLTLPPIQSSHLVKSMGGSRAFTAPPRSVADDPTILARVFGSYVVPRFDPATWVEYAQMNTRLRTAVEEMATASVGLGVGGIPDPLELELLGDEPAKNRRRALLEAAQKLTRFCQRPKRDTFLPLSWDLAKAEVDFQLAGYACLEVMEENREAGGAILGLGHVRAAQMRINAERTRWVQGVNFSSYGVPKSDAEGNYAPVSLQVQAAYYRVYGDPDPAHRFIDRFTGEFFEVWPAGRDEKRKGHAIISGASYNPLDPYYGMPIHVTSLYAILENDMMAKFMKAFLEKGTQVPILFLVEKGQLTPDSMEKIEAIFNSDAAGLDNAGRAAVIQPNVAGAFGQQATIRVERVELGIKDLAPLFERRATNDSEVLEPLRMGGLFIGGGGAGQQTSRNAGVLKQIGYEHGIEPRTAFWEALLNNGLAPRIAPGAVFRARRPRNLDPVQVASIMGKLKEGLSVNELRGAARELLPGINIPQIQIGSDGSVPMAMLKHQMELELAEAKVVPAPDAPTEENPKFQKLQVAS